MAFVVAVFILFLVDLSKAARFSISYENNTFIKDGVPYQYISGSVHYFRIPEHYWQDRLQKIKAAGLTAITTYAPWNFHHVAPNKFVFDGANNVFKFLDLAQTLDLDVIFRGLPYSCGEYTFGGIPPWILTQNPNITLRRSDPVFMGYVKQWFSVFLPKLRSYLYHNGGPVILVQVENEYGSWPACDHEYMNNIASLMMSYLGPETVLFTTDGDGTGYLKCGTIREAYATVDFGPGFGSDVFKPQREYEPHGPLVNSEYYVGWLDHWGQGHSKSKSEVDVKYLIKLLNMKANVNMYMFHGGTNFGFTNGANYPSYQPQPTSYDYDAPISEAGDVTTKYVAIAHAVRNYRKLPPVAFPKNSTKYAYGKVPMRPLGTLSSFLPFISSSVWSQFPLTMEQVQHYEGLILYRVTIPRSFPGGTNLTLTAHDRGYVSLNGIPQGIVSRMNPQVQSLNLASTKSGDVLDILVENQGRINYGSGMHGDFKGIVSNVTLGNVTLCKWTMYSIDFGRLTKFPHAPNSLPRETTFLENEPFHPATLLIGEIPSHPKGISNIMPDTFIDPSSWGKGFLFLNNFNLGRYWPTKGPQITLFAPGPFFKNDTGKNIIMMVEIEKLAKDLTLNLVDTPNLTGSLKSRWHYKGGH